MKLQPIDRIRSVAYGITNPNPYVILVKSNAQEGEICAIEVSDDKFFDRYGYIRYSVYMIKKGLKWKWVDFDLRPERITYFHPDGTEEYILG